VLEGRARFRCADEDIAAGPGSFVFLPRDMPHTFVVEGGENAHMLATTYSSSTLTRSMLAQGRNSYPVGSPLGSRTSRSRPVPLWSQT
jgi:hypothetical protein